ncbi:MAG: peptidylprolyl isomerase [Bacilli bacterium]|nr:peptidylprolyl isomerase [Bacilli bacterium]
MKKSKLSLGLISCLLSVGTLAGCDTLKSSSDGVLLSYTVDGVEGKITADEILGDYYNDSTKYQAIYDTIYSVIARNYFAQDRETVNYHGTEVKLGKPQMATIERDAKEKVSDDKDTAQTNADTNNTKYKKEFEAILESKGVDSEEELLEKYIEELQKETFENNFYTYKIEDIKNGKDDVKLDDKQFWNGYLNDQLPYHVSHILVKLADTSDTNYHNGTISEANAERLYNVIDELGAGAKKFAKIAMTYNEDPGSKDKEGDLGIMDLSTSFINEFKLGIYAYEQFYLGTNVSAYPDFKVSDEIAASYKSAAQEAFYLENDTDIPTVKASVFDELKAVAKDETDDEGKTVIENATLVYPRNIIYNKYLNRHAVFFIEGEGTNYKKAFGDTKPAVLCADGDVTKPIIAVRASSGGEQEIHLMVVNRSPFVATDANGVSLTDYYTTFYPAQDFYPTDTDGKKLQTYVNFLTNEASDTKNRAEEFASKLKSYDSDKLGKYIFLKYMQEEHIEFKDSALKDALMKWIKTSVEKSAEEKKESWTKTWNEYIDKLVRQNSERSKLVPQACRIGFKKANTTKTFVQIVDEDTNLTAEQKTAIKAEMSQDLIDLELAADQAEADAILAKTVVDEFKKEGGLCNDGKAHL